MIKTPIGETGNAHNNNNQNLNKHIKSSIMTT